MRPSYRLRSALHDCQALFDEAFVNQVRRDLVFDAGPHLVGVDERQSRLVAARPTAKQQAGLMSHGVTGPLRICVLAEIGLEVVAEDGLQGGANVLLRERRFDSVDARHPCTDHAVGEASLIRTDTLGPSRLSSCCISLLFSST